jgi:ribosomal protein L11 methyltransferase
LRRVSVHIPAEEAEPARARMLELFPEGFEESGTPGVVELAAYTDAGGEERVRHAFAAVSSAPVEPDWAERWREFHRPVEAGPFWVGPSWEPVPASALAIVIDPGRAFGTGAHATTRLCLELLAAGSAGSLLDVGCGSGVLAIAGAKLGCAPVVAVDIDPEAVSATRANADRNGVTIETRRADALDDPLPAVDLVVANMTLAQVETLAPRLHASRLIASGYLETEAPVLGGFDRCERRTLEGWAADVFERVA